jgi:Ca2+-binding EF-hand superfamily protein
MVDTTKYAATFQLVDGDGDGLITAGELQRLMQALGVEVSDAEAAEFVRKADQDGDERISLDEFAQVMADRGT